MQLKELDYWKPLKHPMIVDGYLISNKGYIRNTLLSKSLDFASEMMYEKQEFSDEIMGEITSAMNRPEVKAARDIAIFFHDAFRTINSYQTKAIISASKRYPKKSSALEDHIKGIKKDTKTAMQALTNQFRIEFKKLDLTSFNHNFLILFLISKSIYYSFGMEVQ